MPGPKLLIPLTLALSVLLIAILYQRSWRPNTRRNGFDRVLAPLVLGKQLTLPASAVISGQNRHFVYLYTGEPGVLFKVRKDSLSLAELRLAFPTPLKLIQTYISDSEISVLDRNTGMVAHFSDSGALIRNDTITLPVSNGCRLAKDTYLFKTVDTGTMKPNLVFYQKGDQKCWPLSIWAGANLDYFSQDGFLVADPDSMRGCYVFYYHNTVLRVNGKGHVDRVIRTIDTIRTSTVKGHLAKESGSKLMTLGNPSLVTNRSGCIDAGILYIYSGLRADNQEAAVFSSGRTIDRYDLSDGRYLSSVFVPMLGKEKAKQFIARGDSLFVLYEHCFAIFHMNARPGATARQ